MWSDNETTDDLFGFRVHADLIRELIMDPSVLPATIGIFGDWGGGKSSIMQMLRDDFEKETAGENVEANLYKGVAVLYFNGWLFEGYDDAKAALLSSILTALRDHKRFGPKLKQRALVDPKGLGGQFSRTLKGIMVFSRRQSRVAMISGGRTSDIPRF
jgi:predicted KAP-like P-loop ATPase